MFSWILGVIEGGGYFGIFTLMVLENLFPPIPSELIIPLAGFIAARGDLDLIVVVLVGSLGAVVGCLPWYYLGRWFGLERVKMLSDRFGRITTLSVSDVESARQWFNRYGVLAVLFGRLVPTIRTLISIPAGIARMPLSSFLIFSFIGSFLWTGILATLGYVLESQYEVVAQYVDPISNTVIILIVFYYLYRVITFKK